MILGIKKQRHFDAAKLLLFFGVHKYLKLAFLALVLGVVLLPADEPEVRTHCFLATGEVFLRLEGFDILRDVQEVRLACFDHRCDGLESLACP